MEHRIKRLQKLIKKSKAQAYWCCQAANRRYLSGFTGSSGWLVVPATGQAVLITDGRYQEQAKQECRDIQIIISQESPPNVLAAILVKRKINKLLFEDNIVSVATWSMIKRKVKGLKGFPSPGLVEKARQVKDDEEVRCIKKAVKIADQAFNKILPIIKAGLSELDVVQMLENAMMVAGGEGLAFPTIVASGKNSSLPHANPSKKQLKKGELVVIDFGCVYKGYHSDLTRTIAIAKMTAKQQELYKIVKKAQISAQKLIISGKLTAESDQKAREIFKNSKIEDYFVHSLGHGLGLEIHESPRLSIKAQELMVSGMVVTCEPGIYIPGWGGIRIEDDILVKAHKSIWLSKSPETLQVVG